MSTNKFEGLAAQVNHLETTHHAYVREALPRLVALGNEVAESHGDTRPELLRVAGLLRTLEQDWLPHLEKEEHALFPMICELQQALETTDAEFDSVEAPIGTLSREHEVTKSLLSELRNVTGDYELPEGTSGALMALYQGLVELEMDTEAHIYKKDEMLFPAALAAETELLARAKIENEAGPGLSLGFR